MSAWGPDGRSCAVCVSFDNLGEVTDLQRGRWPEGEPLGRHFSVTRALPRILELLREAGVQATFFVEGLNTELYPETLTELGDAGHEVGCHGWCHEQWADLEPSEEAELLERCVRAFDALGLRPAGFRPPGGRLTHSTPKLLRGLGFTHCSPAGTGAGTRAGVAVLPFAWTAVDAYHYLPRFAALRERDRGSSEPLEPAQLGARLDHALREAVARGEQLSVVFHPFLAEPDERLGVIRRFLAAVGSLVDDGVAWIAPHRDVAAWLLAAEGGGDPAPDGLTLDATPA